MGSSSSPVPPCFSSQCGLCDSCCGYDQKASPYDCIVRAENLAKFSGSMSIQIEKYRADIGTLMYREQECLHVGAEAMTGIIPERFKVDEALFKPPSVYTLLESPHGAICDTPKCKTMYTGSPEYFHMSWFPKVPVYTREHDDGCQLCILCLKEQGNPVLPKL